MLSLRDTGSYFGATGESIPFEQGDLVEVIEQDSGGEEASDAAADDDSFRHGDAVER